MRSGFNNFDASFRNLQREAAEEAPLYYKQKRHYWRQRKTIQGDKFIDYI
jgi:hypothetical protein